MAHPPSALLRTLVAVLCLGALLGTAVPSAAAPPVQDSTPTATESAATVTPTATAAPPSGSATLTAVDTSTFPALRAYLLVNAVDGARVGALTQAAISLSENGEPVSGLTVAETDVGVQVVFVIDANDAFETRDANGTTRLDHIEAALNTFVSGSPRLKPGLDLVTVLSAEGPLVERSDNPALITQALSRYESSFGGAADAFPLLNLALDYALDVTPRPAMRRYVVFLSNGLNQSAEDKLATIAARASGLVPIYTVFVGPTGADNTVGSQNLLRLAEATGGQRLILGGPDSLAPLFQLLSDRGRQYELSYRSGLAVTGQHTLAARVRLPGSEPITSNPAGFPLRVEAPMLTLAGVPASVVRVAPSHDADPALAEPTVLEVPLGLDFPDNHPRGLRLAQLLVDGQAVVTQTNTLAPSTLAWPLAAVSADGEHQLQVRVIDELGLAAESEVVVVSVSLQVPAAPPDAPLLPQTETSWPLLWVALTGIGLALAVGLGAWLLLARRQRQAALAAETDLERVPPVHTAGRGVQLNAPAPRTAGRIALPHISWPHVSVPTLRWGSKPVLTRPKGLAYFEVVEAGRGAAPRPDIDVVAPSLSLGRDAAVADTVFHDRSVSRLHARVLLKDRRVRIVDQGSTSGTWVNYSPVQGQAGCELQHGDLVNLGRVQLRFLRRDLPANGHGARVIVASAPAPAVPALPIPTAGVSAGASDKVGS